MDPVAALSGWLASGLATYYILVAWLESPLPFAGLRLVRSRAQAARDAGWRWGELVTCPICLAFYLGPLVYLVHELHPWGALAVTTTAVGGLAVALVRVYEPAPPPSDEAHDHHP